MQSIKIGLRETGTFISQCLCLLLLVGTTAAQRAVPEANLATPVLINLDLGGSGSGFFLNDHKFIYLVTARHVLYRPKLSSEITPQKPDSWVLRSTTCHLVSYSKDPTDPTPNVTMLDLGALETAGNIKRHPTQDIAVIKLFIVPPPGAPNFAGLFAGVTMAQKAKDGIVGTEIENIKTYDQTLIGNDIMVFGYPSSIGLQNTPQIDYQRPLIRKGIVAGSNPSKKSLVLDCSVYFGNSGGAVVEIDQQAFQITYKVIGVVTEYIPFNQTASSETIGITLFGNSGYSIATPMDFVLELLK